MKSILNKGCDLPQEKGEKNEKNERKKREEKNTKIKLQ